MPVAVALIAHLSWSTEGEARAWNHVLIQPTALRNHYLVKLLSHLVLFGFIYPADRNQVPGWVLRERVMGAITARLGRIRPAKLWEVKSLSMVFLFFGGACWQSPPYR